MLKRIAGKAASPALARLYWPSYARQARRLGLDRLYLILSFDCDTPQDAEAATRLDPWLRERGIKATYAVPGETLQQGAASYHRLAADGAEFINHGALPHTEWRGGRYWSITFYHAMSPQDVAADIRRGHHIVADVIGRPPVGFRAPHFGLFQRPAQLRLQYDTLRELGYHYSTSTMPRFAMRRGPVFDVGGLWEIPLSGTYRQPFRVFDSWSYLRSPQDRVLKGQYSRAFIHTVDRLLARRIPGVLNYYVDPAHVVESAAFRQAIEHVVTRQIPTLHYTELLAMIRGQP